MRYTSPTTAMAHQVAARAACDAKPPAPCAEDVFAYLMDMGTGKSKVILDEFGEGAISGGPLDLLVIGPAGSYRNWFEDKSAEQPSELNRHCDPEFRERLIDVPWQSGGGAAWRRSVDAMLRCRDKKRPRALFVNVEALSKRDKAYELVQEFLDQRGAFMCVDESTTIKGQGAKRAQNVVQLGQEALTKRILSGLWTPRSPMDLFMQCSFLSPDVLGAKNYYTFRARYAQLIRQNFGGRKFMQIVGYQNLDELQEKVARYSYRVLKKDCLDLAPKTYVTRDVDLTDEQKRMIKEIRAFGHASIGDTGKFVTTDMVIKQIMRLHMINCGFVVDDEDRIVHEVPERRTEALMETLEQHSGKAIIWAPFRRSVDRIVSALAKEYGPESVAQFHGGNKSTRGAEERRFLSSPACRFMVATQAAGMRGNTWTVADLTVYYANNYDLEQRDQSEDRNHRKGQRNPVTYVDLIARGTVDEKMVKSLRQKIDMATMINNEEFREWLI